MTSPANSLPISPTCDPEWVEWKGPSILPDHLAQEVVELLMATHSVTILGAWAVHGWMLSDWSFVNTRGSLMKRFKNVVFKKTGVEPSETVLRLLERKISEHRQDSVFYRITNDLDWTSGDYADDGSCFFGTGAVSRFILCNANAMALQVRAASEGDKVAHGIGRCWVIPVDNGLGLTNFYGLPKAIQVRIFKEHLDKLGHKVEQERIQISATNGRHSTYSNGDGVFFYLKDTEPPRSHSVSYRLAKTTECRCYLEALGRAYYTHPPICTNCFGTYKPEAREARERAAQIEREIVVVEQA